MERGKEESRVGGREGAGNDSESGGNGVYRRDHDRDSRGNVPVETRIEHAESSLHSPPLQPFNQLKVPVECRQRNLMFDTERRDP